MPIDATPAQLNVDKMRALIAFFLDRGQGDRNLGKTKLMKLLYYADFLRYQQDGIAITGATYHKLPQGPVAPKAMKILAQMEKDRVVSAERETRGGYTMNRYTLLDEAVADQLTADEVRTADAVWKRWGSASTGQIVDASHRDPPWRIVEMGEAIPYEMANLISF